MQFADPRLFRQHCYVNGSWIDAANGKKLVISNPFDGSLIGRVPCCGISETQQAINAAAEAWKNWRETTAKQRATLLRKWATLINQHQEDLAKLMTLEQGKPLAEARGEIIYAKAFVEWFAEEALRAYGDVIPAPQLQQKVLVTKQPIGVVAAITPWNFPAAMITRKCAPALAAGCTVVLKPAEATPFSAFALAELAHQAGFPPGVINILTGDANEIGQEFCHNSLVRKLSFTGSTRVGKLLMAQSASTVKKISLELGGNAPFIVFEDANIDAAVNGAMASKFRNAGQTCVCANRFLVHEKIYDVFVEKFVEQVKKLRVGNGLDDDVTIGPLINKAAIAKVQGLVNDAVQKGAKIICGGRVHNKFSYCFEPTVLTHVHENMQLMQEEIFGPVAPILSFTDDQQAVQIANNTPYGLAGYFYSRDIGRIWRIAEQLEYGIVSINAGSFSTEVAPFGGMKESGIGREGSKYGLEEFLETKYLCMGY